MVWQLLNRSPPKLTNSFYHLIFELIWNLLSHQVHKTELLGKLLIKYGVIIPTEAEKIIWRRLLCESITDTCIKPWLEAFVNGNAAKTFPTIYKEGIKARGSYLHNIAWILDLLTE